jgi:hypothetical protein
MAVTHRQKRCGKSDCGELSSRLRFTARITVDDSICVANHRVQIFDNEGNFLRQMIDVTFTAMGWSLRVTLQPASS